MAVQLSFDITFLYSDLMVRKHVAMSDCELRALKRQVRIQLMLRWSTGEI